MAFFSGDQKACRAVLRSLAGVFLALSLIGTAAAQTPPDEAIRYTLSLPKGGLYDLMRWHESRVPLVSQHRGGPMPGYPENAIETLDHALKFGPGILEVDVRQLKDGTLILMHDRTLGRTTTGEGSVAEARWDDVKNLFLEDNDGALTDFRVPTLAEALTWAKGRAILNLDIKRGVAVEAIVAAVRAAEATDHAMLISYTLEQAKAFHAAAPEMMINVGMRDMAELAAAKSSGINPARIVAWTGLQERDPRFYDAIHAEGWRVSMGTLGFNERAIDRQIAASGDDSRYLALYDAGVDIISTDRHWALQKVLFTPTLVFFRRTAAQ